MRTVLKKLEDRSSEAVEAACNLRPFHSAHNQLSYREGEAMAFTVAHQLVKDELRILCNKFQNGVLTADDFGV